MGYFQSLKITDFRQTKKRVAKRTGTKHLLHDFVLAKAMAQKTKQVYSKGVKRVKSKNRMQVARLSTKELKSLEKTHKANQRMIDRGGGLEGLQRKLHEIVSPDTLKLYKKHFC